MRGFSKTGILLSLAIFLFYPISADARTYIDTETPIEIQIAANKYGAEYGICPELIESICYQESRFDEQALDASQSCYGLMQVQKISHRERMNELGVSDLYDIDSNVHVATDYLAELFEQYEDVGTVLMVYHGEKDAVLKSERGEVSKYAREILERSYMLEDYHGKHDLKVR